MTTIYHKAEHINEESMSTTKTRSIYVLGEYEDVLSGTPLEEFPKGMVIRGSLITLEDELIGTFTMKIKCTVKLSSAYDVMSISRFYDADGNLIGSDGESSGGKSAPYMCAEVHASNTSDTIIRYISEAFLNYTKSYDILLSHTPGLKNQECAYVSFDSVYMDGRKLSEREWPKWISRCNAATIKDYKEYKRAAAAETANTKSAKSDLKAAAIEAAINDGESHTIYVLQDISTHRGGAGEYKISISIHPQDDEHMMATIMKFEFSRFNQLSAEPNNIAGRKFIIDAPVTVDSLENRINAMTLRYVDFSTPYGEVKPNYVNVRAIDIV